MDSRRSIHSCRGAGCGRRDVGLGAAGKTPVEGGAAVTNRPVEMLTFQRTLKTIQPPLRKENGAD
jgi:hypothetical protein